MAGHSDLSGTLHGATVCGEKRILLDTFFYKYSEVNVCNIRDEQRGKVSD
jgi:hypothetical protein